MSRKFRWFLLASCAFLIVMSSRETFALLARGPQAQSPSPERLAVEQDDLKRAPAHKPSAEARLRAEGELARGN